MGGVVVVHAAGHAGGHGELARTIVDTHLDDLVKRGNGEIEPGRRSQQWRGCQAEGCNCTLGRLRSPVSTGHVKEEPPRNQPCSSVCIRVVSLSPKAKQCGEGT